MEKSQKNIGDWASENKFIQFVVRVGNFLPVVFIVLLVMWSYYAFVVRLCILHLLNENSTQGVTYLVIYHPLLLMMMWCYFVATFTSPGYPDDPISPKSSRLLTLPGTTISSQHNPSEIHGSPEVKNSLLLTKTGSSKQKPSIILDESGNPVSLGAIMVKQSGEKRYCQKCQYDKPDRTHHCRVCKRCILKMDHHCPWLNNCIGFRNQKSFYLFVIWGSLYSLYITIATIPPTVNYLQYSNEATIMSLDLNISFLILIGGVFALSLLGFAIYHTSLLLSNQTTLESLMTKQNFKMRETDEVTTGKLLNLYDVGKRANFLQVMGPTWYLWFFPVGEPMGDGKTWLLNTARYSSLINSTDNLPGTPQTV